MKLLLIHGTKSKDVAAQNLIQEAKKHFGTVLSIPLKGIRIECSGGETKIFYKETDLTKFDAVYARLFSGDFVFGQVVLDLLEQAGLYNPATLDAYQITNHKYYTVKMLSKIGAPVPATSLCVGSEPALGVADEIGFPMVVKLISGFGGKGVMQVQSEAEFRPLLDTLNVFKELISTQEFLRTKGGDLRCYVVGDRIYAINRFAAGGDWRTNVSRGGIAKEAEFPEEYRELVMATAKLLGLEIGAIDLLETDRGPVIVEVNYSPGMIIKFFGKKFAELFIRHIYDRAVRITGADDD